MIVIFLAFFPVVVADNDVTQSSFNYNRNTIMIQILPFNDVFIETIIFKRTSNLQIDENQNEIQLNISGHTDIVQPYLVFILIFLFSI